MSAEDDKAQQVRDELTQMLNIVAALPRNEFGEGSYLVVEAAYSVVESELVRRIGELSGGLDSTQ